MQLLPALIEAVPATPEPTLRGWAAVQAADGLGVAGIGMGVVFVALFLIFLLMKGLTLVLEPRPAPVVAPAVPKPAPRTLRPEPVGPSPQLVAAISIAIRLEQQRRAARVPSSPPGASGWVAARSLQWAAHQRIFQRHR